MVVRRFVQGSVALFSMGAVSLAVLAQAPVAPSAPEEKAAAKPAATAPAVRATPASTEAAATRTVQGTPTSRSVTAPATLATRAAQGQELPATGGSSVPHDPGAVIGQGEFEYPFADAPGGPEASNVERLFPQDGWLGIRGWLDAGYIYNTANPDSRFNGVYNSQDRNQEPMFNQAYVIIERPLPQGGGIGGRIDILYGEDFLVAQSIGLEVAPNGTPRWNGMYYGIAIPQSYLELGNETLSVKLGHFYSIVGYEGVQSIGNFFYTHAYSYQFAGPFTHWGGLATWNLSDQLAVQAGLHNGWNQLYATENHLGFIGGAKYTGCDKNWWSSFAVTTGEEFTNVAGLPGVPNAFGNRTRYSLLFALLPTEDIEYVFHHWLGGQQNGAVNAGAAVWYGIDQYLYYRLSDCWRAGLRGEWFRDEEGTRVGLNRGNNPNKPPFPGSFYSITAGLNWTPCPNLIVRPEARWDWFSGTGNPYDDGARSNQFLLGVDAILQF